MSRAYFSEVETTWSKVALFLLVVLGDEILPCIIWELIHKLIRHEIRIPFQFKYFKSMSLRWVLNSPQISLKNTDFYPFFLEGGVRTFSTLGGGFLRYLSNFSPRKLGKMNPFDFFAK